MRGGGQRSKLFECVIELLKRIPKTALFDWAVFVFANFLQSLPTSQIRYPAPFLLHAIPVIFVILFFRVLSNSPEAPLFWTKKFCLCERTLEKPPTIESTP